MQREIPQAIAWFLMSRCNFQPYHAHGLVCWRLVWLFIIIVHFHSLLQFAWLRSFRTNGRTRMGMCCVSAWLTGSKCSKCYGLPVYGCVRTHRKKSMRAWVLRFKNQVSCEWVRIVCEMLYGHINVCLFWFLETTKETVCVVVFYIAWRTLVCLAQRLRCWCTHACAISWPPVTWGVILTPNRYWIAGIAQVERRIGFGMCMYVAYRLRWTPRGSHSNGMEKKPTRSFSYRMENKTFEKTKNGRMTIALW